MSIMIPVILVQYISIVNQNNFLLGVQILVFMSLFGYVIFNYDKVFLHFSSSNWFQQCFIFNCDKAFKSPSIVHHFDDHLTMANMMSQK